SATRIPRIPDELTISRLSPEQTSRPTQPHPRPADGRLDDADGQQDGQDAVADSGQAGAVAHVPEGGGYPAGGGADQELGAGAAPIRRRALDSEETAERTNGSPSSPAVNLPHTPQ
ncbi:hypothetical protein N4G69_55135, partial [Streptomyces mirabilis]|uniref:hypothetical protein n=1 Tax=Streptomyces mirabilis TaxID=68239 RepID=UPI0021C15523